MKTSVLVSGFAALCLLVTFAEAPRRHGDTKIFAASKDHISIAAMNKPTMLPGAIITNYRNKETGVTIPVVPAEDFSYLKFDLTKYLESDAITLNENEVMADVTEADYNCLKFDLSDYIFDSEFIADEIPELSVSEFEHLRFDVNDFTNTLDGEFTETTVLPLEEVKINNQTSFSAVDGKTDEYTYLKFKVSEYYKSANPFSDIQFELPEE